MFNLFGPGWDENTNVLEFKTTTIETVAQLSTSTPEVDPEPGS